MCSVPKMYVYLIDNFEIMFEWIVFDMDDVWMVRYMVMGSVRHSTQTN